MVDYHAYILGKVGQVLQRKNFKTPDDQAALEHARQYAKNNDVDVWQEGRLVGSIKAE